jgi:multidrug efflux pump subunit AcrB
MITKITKLAASILLGALIALTITPAQADCSLYNNTYQREMRLAQNWENKAQKNSSVSARQSLTSADQHTRRAGVAIISLRRTGCISQREANTVQKFIRQKREYYKLLRKLNR